MDITKKTKLAIEYLQAGNLQQAEHSFRKILKMQPNNISALHFIGMIYYQRKNYDSAIKYIGKALQLAPEYADAHNNLGIILQEIDKFDEAVKSYIKAIELRPDFYNAYCNLGIVLQEMGQLDKAVDCYSRAIQINPDFPNAYLNLGNAFKAKWQLDDAVSQYQNAIRRNPNFDEAYNKLANVFHDQGKLKEAEEHYRRALSLNPSFIYYDNLLMMMNYSSDIEEGAIFADHLKYARQFEAPLASAIVPHKNDRSSTRRLRIGYVSQDFRRHSVNYFIEPILASHNHDNFEVVCYSDVLTPDNVTKRIQEYSDQWRDIKGMRDEEVTKLIRQDSIDILLDLAGHTANNRLQVFARKPAPVQVSWIGYPNTTGLSHIDYRIVDNYTDPPGLTDPFCSEKLIRMPECFLCYLPDKGSPAVRDLPALKSGYVTFGSFNYFPKISKETVKVWSAILKELPDSRLIMKTRNFADSRTRQYAMDMFIQHGTAPERIDLLAMKTSFEEHLDTYGSIDIALDTFPYNGTTTTCEALWMGVPVITFAGNVHASRVGNSLLTNTGLYELIANSFEEYISIAINLAKNLKNLQALRESLRDKISHSPLADANKFIVNLENCYRKIWEQWCAHR